MVGYGWANYWGAVVQEIGQCSGIKPPTSLSSFCRSLSADEMAFLSASSCGGVNAALQKAPLPATDNNDSAYEGE